MQYLLLIPAASTAVFAFAFTDFDFGIEAWTRFGIAGGAMVALIILAARVMPNREREKDKMMTENIASVLRTSEINLKAAFESNGRQTERVCERIDDMKTALEKGQHEVAQVLRETLFGFIQHSKTGQEKHERV